MQNTTNYSRATTLPSAITTELLNKGMSEQAWRLHYFLIPAVKLVLTVARQ